MPSNKRPSLRSICKRITVEFLPEDAARLTAALERARETNPFATMSEVLRRLVRENLPPA